MSHADTNINMSITTHQGILPIVRPKIYYYSSKDHTINEYDIFITDSTTHVPLTDDNGVHIIEIYSDHKFLEFINPPLQYHSHSLNASDTYTYITSYIKIHNKIAQHR